MATLQDYLDQINEFDVNDIDWTRMGVWPIAGKVVLCVLIVVALVVAGYFFIIKDLNEELDRVTAKEAQLKTTFKSKVHEAINLEAYREQMKEMEVSFGALVAQLPSDTEVPGLLEDIDEKGAGAGLSINSITLKPEVAQEFYVELPITIDVTGPYHDFGTFVSGVAGMPRIVTLHDYEISREKDSNLLNMQIMAKTYRYKAKE